MLAAPEYTVLMSATWKLVWEAVLAATFRCLQVLHALDLPGTPTIPPSRVAER